MKNVFSLILIFALVLSFSSLSVAENKPVKSKTPLSADEIAIYKAVLEKYASKEVSMLNVSATTYPLDSDSSKLECLKGVEWEPFDNVVRSFHDLHPDVLPGKKMRLVDPEEQGKKIRDNDPSKTMREGKSVDAAVRDAFNTGMFSMSEIIFDKERRYAKVSYSFRCGSLCGNGAIVVFEKIDNKWKTTGLICRAWVS